MDKSEATRFLMEFHEQRKLNDADALLEFFTEDAEFSIAGETRDNSIALRVGGPGAFAELLRSLVSDWEWINVDFKNIATDGDTLIARYFLTIHHVPADRTVTTDVVDIMEMRDGKVASMRQFVDTAHLSAIALGDNP
ncbi:MAG: nuclear transport factor 2 family protein [Boseongicola sp.]